MLESFLLELTSGKMAVEKIIMKVIKISVKVLDTLGIYDMIVWLMK